MCSRHPASRAHRACPEAPLPRAGCGSWRPRGSGALSAKEKRDGEEGWSGGRRQDLLRSTCGAAHGPAGSYWGCRALPTRTGQERGPSREARLTHLLLTPRPHRSLLPAVFSRLFIHWIKLRRDLAGKKSLPFLWHLPRNRCSCRLSFLVGCGQHQRQAASPHGAGAFPSRVAAQQTCCWPWPGSRVTQAPPRPPSRPDPSGRLISSRLLRAKGVQGWGEAAGEGSVQPSWQRQGGFIKRVFAVL